MLSQLRQDGGLNERQRRRKERITGEVRGGVDEWGRVERESPGSGGRKHEWINGTEEGRGVSVRLLKGRVGEWGG